MIKHQNLVGQKVKSFYIIDYLGEGMCAKVYEAFDEITQTRVAIKAIPKKLFFSHRKMEQLLKTEIKVLKNCKNQNVIKFIDCFQLEQTQLIVTQYCNGGNLQEYLEKKQRLTEEQATKILKQILNGFKGLHELKAMHRDFKISNILLHEGECKIADLGLAKLLENEFSLTQTYLGTAVTMAPQVLSCKQYGMEADIWSIGVVYYQLLYGNYPYFAQSQNQLLKQIKLTKPNYKAVNISPNAKDFLEKCLTVDPKNRISWKNIYNHDLIKKESSFYVHKSKLNVIQNEQFYHNLPNYEEFQKKPIIFEPFIVPKINFNVQKVKKEAEQKKRILQAIQKYETLYINHRNNIMFPFKYIAPIYTIPNINVNHPAYLFILSKKAYNQMNIFHKNLSSNINFLKQELYFKQFIQSSKYQPLIEMAASDLMLIQDQMVFYQEEIEYCSKLIQNEKNVLEIKHNNWEKFVYDTIKAYQRQLTIIIQETVGEQNQNLIKGISALIYLKQHINNANAQQFDQKIETLDFEDEEMNIQSLIEI